MKMTLELFCGSSRMVYTQLCAAFFLSMAPWLAPITSQYPQWVGYHRVLGDMGLLRGDNFGYSHKRGDRWAGATLRMNACWTDGRAEQCVYCEERQDQRCDRVTGVREG